MILQIFSVNDPAIVLVSIRVVFVRVHVCFPAS